MRIADNQSDWNSMNPCGALQIGPLWFRLESDAAVVLDYRDWAYPAFIRSATDADDPSVLRTLPVRLHCGGLACPDWQPVFQAGLNWAVWEESGGGYLICSGYHGRAQARRACRVDAELQQADLFVDGDLADEPLRYPLDQVLSWGLLGQCGGVMLHAAVVEKEGRAIALAGRSGAGKSTLSAFCHEAGWSILNDDRAMIFPRAGSWRVAGTPWHGSGQYAENREAPLSAIFLLEQSAENAVLDMPLQAIRRTLLDVSSVPWFEEGWCLLVLSNLERLTTDIPIKRFQCTRSLAAVEALEEIVFSE